MPNSTITVSATEFPQFARLVEFLREVDQHADAECDIALKALVETCHEDLLTRPGTASE